LDKEAKITLGGQEYTVRSFNIAELEEIGQLLDGTVNKTTPFKILAIALRRAQPPVQDARTIELSFKDLDPAMDTIFAIAGLERAPKQNPPAGQAEGSSP
jgi:hypothetical protein